MNVDPDKIKELVLLFFELDDEYQNELMTKAYVLSLKQNQKNSIEKEGMKFKNKSEYDKEIEERSNNNAKKAIDMVELIEKIPDDKKAELFILLDKLGSGKLTQKSDIEIKINQARVPLKDYIEDILPGTDFNLAYKNTMEHLKEIKNT